MILCYSWFCFKHDYIQKAIELGAVVIVCDTFPENLKKELHIQVLDTNKALAFMGLIISVTHLKIKVGWYHWNKRETTIASLLYQLFKKGFKVGLISTVKILVDDEYKSTYDA
jgi:UDP-N-acetylmuramoyl-L-alanyl-D-glutamate--2,6-diaminopimelate ligase